MILNKRIISVLCCLLLLLTGCKGQKKENNDQGTEAPVLSGNISLYMASPDTLHPLYTKQSSNIPIYNLIYDGLLYSG